MPIALTTGVPGAGKTLYTVAEVIKPLVGSTIEYEGQQVPRRLMIGGVVDLLLPHELVEVPDIQKPGYRDDYGHLERMPGDPPHDVVPRGDNWWLWCMPGDVIVLDECQKLFRPMASGRAVPTFIAKLETHRHYGVDFVVITQHPQLLHANVRNLVGQHRHVRRMFGRGNTIVYEWDHCTHPDKTKNATKRFWAHKKAAFGLYKSAEVHTKHKHALGGATWMLAAALLAVPALLWWSFDRTTRKRGPEAPAVEAAPAPVPGQPHALPALEAAPAVQLPMVTAEPRTAREPYIGRAFVLDGAYSAGRTAWASFGVLIDGRRVHTVTLAQLVRAGYVWTEQGPCAGLLIFGDTQRVVTCAPAPLPPAAPQPERPASGAAA